MKYSKALVIGALLMASVQSIRVTNMDEDDMNDIEAVPQSFQTLKVVDPKTVPTSQEKITQTKEKLAMKAQSKLWQDFVHLDQDDENMFNTLNVKMEQLGRNVAQGELGLQVADGKAKDIDLELKQFEQNIETEAADVNKMLAEELNKETPNDHIELNGVDQGIMQDKINKKVTKLNEKFSEVAKMEQEMGQTQFDAAVIKHDLNNSLHKLSSGMIQIQGELKNTKSSKDRAGMLTDEQFGNQMNWVLKA